MAQHARESRLISAFVRLADTLVADFDVIHLLDELVRECTDILDADAGGLTLVDPTGALRLVASTSEDARLVEVLELAADSGPALDSFRTGRSVTVGDIGAENARWPDFVEETSARGFRSVHVTPLRLRGEVLGTMSLFSVSPGELSAVDAAAAQALADVATIGILQERSIRRANLAAEQLQGALDSRVIIEQAKGTLATRDGTSVDEAFRAMRSHARRTNSTLRAVAESIVNGGRLPGAVDADRVPRRDRA